MYAGLVRWRQGQQVLKVLMVLGGLFGVVASVLVAAPAVLSPEMFTQDAEVLRLIQLSVLPALVSLLVSGFLEVVEGVLLVGSMVRANVTRFAQNWSG